MPEPRSTCAPRRRPADGHLFRRLGAARGARAERVELFAPDDHHHARCAAAGGGEPRGRARPAGQRAGRAGGDAYQWRSGGDDRRQGLRRKPRSTASRRRSASRARPSSCSSTSPRCATGGARTTPSQHAKSPKAATGRRTPSGAIPTRSRWREAFAQSSNVAAVRLLQGGGQRGGDRHRAPARGHIGAAGRRSQPGARHVGDEPAGTDRRLCRGGRQWLPGRTARLCREEQGWFDWLFDGKDSLRSDHEGYRGNAARCGQRRHGPRGDAVDPQLRQDRHDAGQSRRTVRRLCRANLVVGVWVGNDDNSPMGVSGGGTPARIWRDFMREALGASAAPPRPTPSPDPSGPVQPQDVPDLRISRSAMAAA